MDTSQLKSVLSPILSDKARFIVIFGSAAKGRLTPKSDIDIGVFFLPQYSHISSNFEELANLREKIENVLQRDFDLVIMNDVDLIMAMEIVKTGQVIFDTSPSSFIPYKQNIISRYIDFKISRRGIEKALING